MGGHQHVAINNLDDGGCLRKTERSHSHEALSSSHLAHAREALGKKG